MAWVPKRGETIRSLENERNEIPIGTVGTVMSTDDNPNLDSRFFYCKFPAAIGHKKSTTYRSYKGFPMYLREIAPLSEFQQFVNEVLDGRAQKR